MTEHQSGPIEVGGESYLVIPLHQLAVLIAAPNDANRVPKRRARLTKPRSTDRSV